MEEFISKTATFSSWSIAVGSWRLLISPPEEGGCTGEPDSADRESVLDKVSISHKEQPDHHRLPSAHSFPMDEADETDAAKKEAGEQAGRREFGHASEAS